ncbi:PQQ-binding-like beta-propeller repeat protein [Phenylobacterium sp. J426]|uniref:outer membrane protein assembly factor BamB family protein n=1 Tax=Phenylobacterium sp. J426 TaxID=2898439 RepID=UPI0021519A20|nr:PQQ-binding-like beta-propeller repeat protein [Phenylobacterium sp. J426]MCR5875976.1 PQQ-binding-like beta-propeller repeat protein [Phenylobacterium sp. J426]
MAQGAMVKAVMAGLVLAGAAAGGAWAQPAADGGALFQARCKMCHEPAVPRAPSREQLKGYSNTQIIDALTTGTMRPMAEGLGRAEIGAIATFLTGRANTAREGALDLPPAVAAAPDIRPDAAALARLGRAKPVTAATLKAPAAGDWLHWGRTYDGLNYSPLTQIDRRTVKALAPAWRAPLQAGPSMPTPLVHDGLMFLQTSPDTVLALDATSGQVLWRRAHKPAGASSQKMGLAIRDGRLYVPTSDLHVLALDARTGEMIWDHQIALSPPAASRGSFNLRSAPLIVGDKLIQGVTASGAPGGAFIVGLDIATGREAWRFHTIARPDAPGGTAGTACRWSAAAAARCGSRAPTIPS